jgi:hypothetical protein
MLLKIDDEILSGVDDLHWLLTLDRANKPCTLLIMRGAHIESVTITFPKPTAEPFGSRQNFDNERAKLSQKASAPCLRPGYGERSSST